jgi:DNA-binding transcriptional regulator LsrR (DeoR family)
MAGMTARQREIKRLLDDGLGAVEIAEKLGITRNAVYQQIQALRRKGEVASDFTPTGQPPREVRAHGGYGVEEGRLVLLQEAIMDARDDLDRIAQRLSRLVPRS